MNPFFIHCWRKKQPPLPTEVCQCGCTLHFQSFDVGPLSALSFLGTDELDPPNVKPLALTRLVKGQLP